MMSVTLSLFILFFRSILKRDTHSLDEPGAGSLANNRSKSLEQREREYEKVRRRIFSSVSTSYSDNFLCRHGYTSSYAKSHGI